MIWLVLGLLLLCSGIVSASETALFGLDRKTLNEFRGEGPLRRRVYRLMQNPRRVLMTVLMVNTAVNVAIFAVSYVALRHIGNTSMVVAAFAGLAAPLAVIVFGEVLPKAMALSNARRFAPSASGFINVAQTVVGPARAVLSRLLVEPITRLLAPSTLPADSVTTDELRLLVEQSAREGVINSSENDMLQSIVALSTVSVREVMTPRVDIQSVGINDDREALLSTIHRTRLRRLLVHGRDLDDIRGVLYARDVFLDTATTKLIRRAHYIPEQLNLLQLLRLFREERVHLGVVVDEYGGTSGLVTVNDVVKWIVGELPDVQTIRLEPTFERIDEDTYQLGGDLSVRVWADRFGVGEVDRNIHTVGGFVLARLGRLPRIGDSIRLRNLTLTVRTMRGKRIETVRLHRHTTQTREITP
jgi:CBS domain containing-hemolysin-like protein